MHVGRAVRAFSDARIILLAIGAHGMSFINFVAPAQCLNGYIRCNRFLK